MAAFIRQLITRDDEAKCKENPNLCEKPAISDKATYIVIGSIMGAILVGVFIVLTIFHLRRKRSDAQEWTKDPQELEDYGIDAAAMESERKKHMAQMNGGAAANSTQSLAHSLRDKETQNPFGTNAEIISDSSRQGAGHSSR